MTVASVYLWKNEMVMVFGTDGEQIPELQGKADQDRIRAIQRQSTASTEWNGFGEEGPLTWR